MKMLATTTRTFAAGLCLTLLLAGCKTPSLLQPTSWTESWTDMWGSKDPQLIPSKFEKPARLVVIWTPATYTEAGKPSTRGFGGRIYFYNAKNQPISVEGQLVVYGYQDENSKSESRVPDRRYGFTPEQFTQHYDETDLGASYSVWIPWDPVGNPTQEISLLPIFTTSAGQVVIGQQSKNVLPGPKAPGGMSGGLSKLSPVQASPWPTANETVPAASSTSGIRRVAYEESLSPSGFAGNMHVSPPTAGVIASDAIPLTRGLTSQMAAAGPTAAPEFLASGSAAQALPMNPAANSPSTSVNETKATGGIPRPWTPQDPRSTRYVRPQFQAPSGQSPQPVRDRSDWQPGPLERPRLSQQPLGLGSPDSSPAVE